VRAGGFLVSELKLHLERIQSRCGYVLFSFGLAAALAFLSSCGSTTTAVSPTITVSCVPSDVTVLTTSQCTANVQNLSSTLVNWSISGTGNGSISSGGLYTAPSTVPTNNVVTVTATSQVQSTLTATQNLTIEAATAITAVTCVDPNTQLASSVVASNNQLACTATASTGATVAVNWTVANATSGLAGNVGSVSSQGIYTAPFVPPPGQMVTITATSQSVSTITKSVTATVVFGSSVLSGNYVFSASGRLGPPSGAFWARVGSFSAGGGVINGGLEDTNQGGTPNIVTQLRSFTGSYSVGPDGRGTMQFCEGTSSPCPSGSSSATAFFRIVVASPQQVQIIEFSPPSATSAVTIAGGEMLLQDSSIGHFTNANQVLSGAYSFNFAGVSTTTSAESVVGDFSSNGFQSIAAGSTTTPKSPGETDTGAGGPVALPASTYTISSNFRGTITLNGLSFSFYPISTSRAKFIEIDQPSTGTTPDSILVGDAYKQEISPTCGWGVNALNGATVLQTTGATSGGVVVGDVGSFTASNNGTTGAVGTGSLDENSGGTISSQVASLSGTFAIDPDGCGRGTLSIGSRTYVFYMISPSSAVLQETDSGTVAHGLLVPSQGGPFVNSTSTTSSTLSGSYALQLAGTSTAGAAGLIEDIVGQLTADGVGNWKSSSFDINNDGTTQTGVANSGTYAADSSPTGTLRGTAHLTTTPNLVLYMVSPTLFYVLEVDPSPAGSTVGVLSNQF